MLPSFAKTPIWHELITELANYLLTNITIEQTTYGSFKTEKNYQESEIFYHTTEFLGQKIIIGPFLTKDRVGIPVWKKEYESIILFGISQAQKAAELFSTTAKPIEKANLFLIFAQMLGTCRTTEEAINSAVNFFVQKFGLRNTSIILSEKEGRYFPSNPLTQEIEKRIIFSISSTNSSYVVRNPKTDILLQNIQGTEEISKNITGIPFYLSNKERGTAIFYSEQQIDLLLFTDFLFEFSKYINRLLEVETAKETAHTDALTGLSNRLELSKIISNVMPKLALASQPISVLMIDADNFKKFNDTNGHLEGDAVLKLIAKVIKELTPETGISCRYGGEEFVVALPETLLENAKKIAEQIREFLEANSPLTVSIGVACCMNSSVSLDRLIKEADTAMYRAKSLGKNKVCSRIMVDKNLGVIDA